MVVMLVGVTLLACTDRSAPSVASTGAEPEDGPPTAFQGDVFNDRIAALVQRQVDQGLPITPRGRAFDRCPAVDDGALQALADVFEADATVIQDLGATVTDPDGQPTLSCPLKFGEASAGAAVLTVGPALGDLAEQLAAANYEEVPDATVAGLPDEQVRLFDSTQFEASRAVWSADGFQISLTGNSDLVASGALLEALPVAVKEVSRVIGT